MIKDVSIWRTSNGYVVIDEKLNESYVCLYISEVMKIIKSLLERNARDE